MTDLSTTYVGLPLRSPLVASSSPLTGRLDDLRALEAAGVAAVVLPSLFEEQIVHEQLAVDRHLDAGAGVSPEFASGFFYDDLDDYNTGPRRYIRHVADARRILDIPVIASLNGTTRGGWVRYARMLQDAGADAVELNVYRVVADVTASGRVVEQELVDLVAAVVSEVTVPVAVKLGPYFTTMAHTASQVADAGASALVLFNRFYQPDIDLDLLDVVPRIVLSESDDVLLPMRWIGILYGRIASDLAATTGIHTGADALKVLLAGAQVAMLTSALLRHGPDHVAVVEQQLVTWMQERAYVSVDQLRGSMSQRAVGDPNAFQRAQYVRTLTSAATQF